MINLYNIMQTNIIEKVIMDHRTVLHCSTKYVLLELIGKKFEESTDSYENISKNYPQNKLESLIVYIMLNITPFSAKNGTLPSKK
jgi:hypothetical protein